MKQRWSGRLGLLLAACLFATATGAGAPKPGSIAELAREIAERLPPRPGVAIYVAMPTWEGHETHYLLCKTINDALGRALSAAAPADKFYTAAQAAGILAKAGVNPLDVYFKLRGRRFAGYAAEIIGAGVAVIGSMQRRGKAISLTLKAIRVRGEKRVAKLSASLDSPQLRVLLSLPDVPVKDSSGVYEAGVGGVGNPSCIHCPNPSFPWPEVRRISDALFALAFTVTTQGRVRNLVLLVSQGTRKMNQRTLRVVRRWRFKPARDPEGEVVPTRILAEIEIRQLPQ